MFNTFFVKRKLNKLLDQYARVYKQRQDILSNSTLLPEVATTQAELLHLDLKDLGVAYDILIDNLQENISNAKVQEFLSGSGFVPNTSRRIVTVLGQETTFNSEDPRYREPALAEARRQTDIARSLRKGNKTKLARKFAALAQNRKEALRLEILNKLNSILEEEEFTVKLSEHNSLRNLAQIHDIVVSMGDPNLIGRASVSASNTVFTTLFINETGTIV